MSTMRAVRRAVVRHGCGADQEPRDLVDGFLRRRQADPRQPAPAQGLHPFQRQRQVAAALAAGDGVDFVDDHGPRGREHGAAGIGTEQHVQRFRRGDEDVWRRPAQRARARTAACRRCAPRCGSTTSGRPWRASSARMPVQRCLEVEVDVVRQRLQRRDVDHLRRVGQAMLQAFAHQRVDRRQERGQRLAGTGRRRDQRVVSGTDRRPCLLLCLGRRRERALEPGARRRDGRLAGAGLATASPDYPAGRRPDPERHAPGRRRPGCR